jgi:hypothetical protein
MLDTTKKSTTIAPEIIDLPERLIERLRDLSEKEAREVEQIRKRYNDAKSSMLVGFLTTQDGTGSAFYELANNSTQLVLANL